MFAIRARRKAITEKDLIEAIDKVIKGYKKFSATGKYMVYNWYQSFYFNFFTKNAKYFVILSNFKNILINQIT